MKVWTVILAGVLLAALPNLGSGQRREDAGVFVAKNYQKFDLRVLPQQSNLACTYTYGDKFQIENAEDMLREFERGNNTMNAKFRLGTPTLLLVEEGSLNNFGLYCKYLPRAYHNKPALSSEWVRPMKLFGGQKLEYFAVMVKNTAPETIARGWNELKKVVKNRFRKKLRPTYLLMFVERTKRGRFFVGAIQNLRCPYMRAERSDDCHLGFPNRNP